MSISSDNPASSATEHSMAARIAAVYVVNSRVVDSGPKLNTIEDETFAVEFETNESEAVELAAKLVGI